MKGLCAFSHYRCCFTNPGYFVTLSLLRFLITISIPADVETLDIRLQITGSSLLSIGKDSGPSISQGILIEHYGRRLHYVRRENAPLAPPTSGRTLGEEALVVGNIGQFNERDLRAGISDLNRAYQLVDSVANSAEIPEFRI